MYSQKLLDHFRHPRNLGEIRNPDAWAQVGNPVCGDVMKIYLKIGKNPQGEETIKEVKFQTLGCAAAIAVSSVLTEMVKGKTLKEALEVKGTDIARQLGGLPPIKFHCSLLGQEALKKAIHQYRKKKDEKNKR